MFWHGNKHRHGVPAREGLLGNGIKVAVGVGCEHVGVGPRSRAVSANHCNSSYGHESRHHLHLLPLHVDKEESDKLEKRHRGCEGLGGTRSADAEG